MCEPTTILLATTALAGGLQAKGQYDQGRMARAVGRNNQIMAEYAAQDAIRRGDEEANKIRQRGDSIKGAQRASMAAKGLDLGVGTAAELQDQTDFFSAGDQGTARNNAQRDAWSARVSGQAARDQGDAAYRQGNLAAFSTLLNTATSVSSKWSDYGGKGWNSHGKGMFAGAKSGDVGF